MKSAIKDFTEMQTAGGISRTCFLLLASTGTVTITIFRAVKTTAMTGIAARFGLSFSFLGFVLALMQMHAQECLKDPIRITAEVRA